MQEIITNITKGMQEKMQQMRAEMSKKMSEMSNRMDSLSKEHVQRSSVIKSPQTKGSKESCQQEIEKTNQQDGNRSKNDKINNISDPK